MVFFHACTCVGFVMSGGSKAKGKNVTSQDDGGERDGRSLPKEIRTNLENHHVPLLLLLIRTHLEFWVKGGAILGDHKLMNREYGNNNVTPSSSPVNPSPLEGAGPDVVGNVSEEEDDYDSLDDSDEDYDDYDSDTSQQSHETRKNSKWFKSLDIA